MTYRWETMTRLASERVVAIIRARDAVDAEELATQALSGGLSMVEVSLTTPAAIDVIGRLSARHADAVIGAGTVIDGTSARLAILAGARFLVSPTFSSDVVRMGHRYGSAVIPGCATANEMMAAVESGADAVKIFPADTLTPRSLSLLREALPQLPCIPTGGVSFDNARQWIEAGAIAVGIGSALTTLGPQEIHREACALRNALTVASA